MDNERGVPAWAFTDPEPEVCPHCGYVHVGVSSISMVNAKTNGAHKIKKCGEWCEQHGKTGVHGMVTV